MAIGVLVRFVAEHALGEKGARAQMAQGLGELRGGAELFPRGLKAERRFAAMSNLFHAWLYTMSR